MGFRRASLSSSVLIGRIIPMPFVKVAQTSDLDNNSARLVESGGKSIALICADGEYFALDNTCTHVGGPLCEGPVREGTITCPWHAAQFDVKTGKALAGPGVLDRTAGLALHDPGPGSVGQVPGSRPRRAHG